MNLNVIDGHQIVQNTVFDVDVVVIGSGPAGASAAFEVTSMGLSVMIVEEGAFVAPREYHPDAFGSMAQLYRDMGTSVTRSSAPLVYLQGKAVGGTSVVNGAISWRLPPDVYQEWVLSDPAISEALSWEEVSAALDAVERRLNIAPTAAEVAGENNLLLGRGADALGLEHRSIRRNVRGCEGLGRCLQGCPKGHKLSMDQTYLRWASDSGARILASTRVETIQTRGNRAAGVVAKSAGGASVKINAATVILAASAVQSPSVLVRSGIKQGPVGENFQAHPGVSVAGFFEKDIKVWSGATQGHEVIGLRKEGIKFEALGFDIAIAGTRLKSVGKEFSEDLQNLRNWAHWGAAIRAGAKGRVKTSRRTSSVSYSLLLEDVEKMRRGVSVLAQMMIAAGAEYVTPGIFGFDPEINTMERAQDIEFEAPINPQAYSCAITHMFGTCRLGSNPQTSVVGLDFQHHKIRGLYVADSSVFPTNTGVNPQTSIIAMASICGRRAALRHSNQSRQSSALGA